MYATVFHICTYCCFNFFGYWIVVYIVVMNSHPSAPVWQRMWCCLQSRGHWKQGTQELESPPGVNTTCLIGRITRWIKNEYSHYFQELGKLQNKQFCELRYSWINSFTCTTYHSQFVNKNVLFILDKIAVIALLNSSLIWLHYVRDIFFFFCFRKRSHLTSCIVYENTFPAYFFK